MSVFPLVLVGTGAVPPVHLNAAGHVIARAVPSAVNSSEKLAATFAGVLVVVIVDIAALSETLKKLLADKSSVNVPDAIAGEVNVSLHACNCNWLVMLPEKLIVPFTAVAPSVLFVSVCVPANVAVVEIGA